MYKTVRGVYKKGKIIPTESVGINQDEVAVMITFLDEEKGVEDNLESSADKLLYTMGDRALEGKFSDASEKHDYYLYSKKVD